MLEQRQSSHRPWHSPPHWASDNNTYLITAACYEHRHILGKSPERMVEFERELLGLCSDRDTTVLAWTALPNHYHLLVRVADMKEFLQAIGHLHGRTSFRWNGEDDHRGRKVWFNALETGMKSERHFWASLIDVLHNAVKHGYVER